MKKLLTALSVVGFVMAAQVAQAAAPQLVPVQGVLTDSAGIPIDSSATMTFSIYTSEVGGTAIWTETQDVLVEDGLFTAYLGDVTAIDLVTFRDNGDLWLGIQVGSDAEMDRMFLGSGPFAGYAEYCGSAPAPDFADITGTVDPADLPSGLVTGPLACTGTDKVTGVDSSGALLCGADVDTDTDTTYSAGAGLLLTGTTFSLNATGLQNRVSGTCAAGNSIRAINVDGSVICEPDTDTNAATLCAAGQFLNGDGTCDPVPTGGGDITGVLAGSGLTGGGTTGTVTLSVGTAAITATHLAPSSAQAEEIFGGTNARIHDGDLGQCAQASGWNAGPFDTDGVWLESCSGESGGFYADGDTAVIWSPGDGPTSGGGLLNIYDEDTLPSGAARFGFYADCGTGTTRAICTYTGAYLTTGGIWTNTSNEFAKQNITPVNNQEILDKLFTLPITSWSYSEEGEAIQHIGPMAQDFHELFGFGDDPKGLGTLDVDGVALASIKALYERNQELETQVQDMQERLAELEMLLGL